MRGSSAAVAIVLCVGCTPSTSSPATRVPDDSQLESRPSYTRALDVPGACDQRLVIERLVCAIEHAVEHPDFERSRRACALRHMRPMRQSLQAVVQSVLKLEEIKARRSPALAEPSAAGPPGSRVMRGEEMSGESSAPVRLSERELRAESTRQEEERALDERSKRAETKLAELFRYVEPCLDARIPFEPAVRATESASR